MLLRTFRLPFWEPRRNLLTKIPGYCCLISKFFLVILSIKTFCSVDSTRHVLKTCLDFGPNFGFLSLKPENNILFGSFHKKSLSSLRTLHLVLFRTFLTTQMKFLNQKFGKFQPNRLFRIFYSKNFSAGTAPLDMFIAVWTACFEFLTKSEIFSVNSQHS